MFNLLFCYKRFKKCKNIHNKIKAFLQPVSCPSDSGRVSLMLSTTVHENRQAWRSHCESVCSVHFVDRKRCLTILHLLCCSALGWMVMTLVQLWDLLSQSWTYRCQEYPCMRRRDAAYCCHPPLEIQRMTTVSREKLTLDRVDCINVRNNVKGTHLGKKCRTIM